MKQEQLVKKKNQMEIGIKHVVTEWLQPRINQRDQGSGYDISLEGAIKGQRDGKYLKELKYVEKIEIERQTLICQIKLNGTDSFVVEIIAENERNIEKLDQQGT